MRQSGDLFMLSGASKRGQFSAAYTINMSGFDFRQAQAAASIVSVRHANPLCPNG